MAETISSREREARKKEKAKEKPDTFCEKYHKRMGDLLAKASANTPELDRYLALLKQIACVDVHREGRRDGRHNETTQGYYKKYLESQPENLTPHEYMRRREPRMLIARHPVEDSEAAYHGSNINTGEW
ncbi:MAG: hypothetical protein HN879_09700 [Flavobacteriaceae bacterium]|nr:hypothetical protein [Flavobacteriaceae bacterium]